VLKKANFKMISLTKPSQKNHEQMSVN